VQTTLWFERPVEGAVESVITIEPSRLSDSISKSPFNRSDQTTGKSKRQSKYQGHPLPPPPTPGNGSNSNMNGIEIDLQVQPSPGGNPLPPPPIPEDGNGIAPPPIPPIEMNPPVPPPAYNSIGVIVETIPPPPVLPPPAPPSTTSMKLNVQETDVASSSPASRTNKKSAPPLSRPPPIPNDLVSKDVHNNAPNGRPNSQYGRIPDTPPRTVTKSLNATDNSEKKAREKEFFETQRMKKLEAERLEKEAFDALSADEKASILRQKEQKEAHDNQKKNMLKGQLGVFANKPPKTHSSGRGRGRGRGRK